MSFQLAFLADAVKRCYVANGLVPARGHIIITPRFVCFWRRATVGADIKVRLLKVAALTLVSIQASRDQRRDPNRGHAVRFTWTSIAARRSP